MHVDSSFHSNASLRGASRNLAALKAEVDEKNGILQSLRRSLAESDEKLARRSQQCRQLMDIVSVRASRAVVESLIPVDFNTASGTGKAHEFH